MSRYIPIVVVENEKTTIETRIDGFNSCSLRHLLRDEWRLMFWRNSTVRADVPDARSNDPQFWIRGGPGRPALLGEHEKTTIGTTIKNDNDRDDDPERNSSSRTSSPHVDGYASSNCFVDSGIALPA